MPKLRVLLTGGGTGGHVYPLIAVAAELQVIAGEKNMDMEIRYLGAFGPFKDLFEINNIKAGRIAESKLRRYSSVLNFIDGPKFIYSIFQAVFKMFWFMPDVVFSKGGPGALAVVLVARFYRIPVIIHESDSVPGLTNYISGKFSQIIAISFESVAEYFPNKEVVLTGNPIRRYLITDLDKESVTKDKVFLGFESTLPLITIMGGSQGASAFNDFVLGNLPSILNITQLMHQTGTANYDNVLNRFKSLARNVSDNSLEPYRLVPYLKEDLRSTYVASELVVSRASAGSIFELAAFGKPSILIPLPPGVAAGDHQTENAKEYCKSGAAILVTQEEMGEKLIQTIKDLLDNRDKLSEMSKTAKSFAKPGAALDIANIILRLSGYVVN